MPKGSSTTTTNSKVSPYAPAQGMIDAGLAEAQQIYKAGGFAVEPYPGQLVADYDPMRAQADAMTPGIVGASLGRSDAAGQAIMGQMDGTVSQAARDAVIAQIMPQVNATFAMDGRTGGGLHYDALGEGLARGLAPLEIDAMDRSLRAAGMMPEVNASQYGALDYLRGAGGSRQGYEQDVIAADAMQHEMQQTMDARALEDYMRMITGVGSAFPSQYGKSKTKEKMGAMGVLGMGLSAASLF